MRIEKKDLDKAAKAGIISLEQGTKIWSFWQKELRDTPQFHFAHVLYYLGGLLAISAVTLFVTRAWDTLVGIPLFLLSTVLFIFGLMFTQYFLNKKLRIPAGIFSTFSLALVPLATYNLQVWLGFSPMEKYQYSDFHYWVNWYWVSIEIVTFIAGIAMFYFYRFQFLLFPISIILWYMSMDVFDLLLHQKGAPVAFRATFSMYFGLLVILAAIFIDLKAKDDEPDYPFWLYIFGVMTFWGGLSSQSSEYELSKFIYCMINLGMIFVSVFLDSAFCRFGAIGVLGYLGHLAFEVS